MSRSAPARPPRVASSTRSSRPRSSARRERRRSPTAAPRPSRTTSTGQRRRRRCAAGSSGGWRRRSSRTGSSTSRSRSPSNRRFEGFAGTGLEEVGTSLSDFFSQMAPPRKRSKRMSRRADARTALIEEETDRLVDMDRVYDDAIRDVEDDGIVFIDEVDKICGQHSEHGPDVTRRGRPARPAPARSRGRPSTPATDRSKPTTSCSSRRARSHVRPAT